MPKLKLSYFDIHGGRGETARLALAIGGIAFEDHRIPGADWPSKKASTPFGSLPVLEVDGQAITQSNGINRYVGKLADLYPSDPLQGLLCDEVLEAIEDIETKIGATFNLSDEDKKRERARLVEGPLALFLTRIQELLVAHGGEYLAGGRLSVADLRTFVWIRRLRSGILDHIPKDLADRLAPRLVALQDRIKELPAVKAHYAKHGVS